MACDACAGAELSRFEDSLGRAFAVLVPGLALGVTLLVLAWRRRNPTLAALAPPCVALSSLLFHTLVAWPD
jgi:hypothetical protein